LDKRKMNQKLWQDLKLDIASFFTLLFVEKYGILVNSRGGGRQMKKKKTNPNKIPLSRTNLDFRQSTGEVAEDIVFLAWIEVLGALADFPEMSQERIWALWKDINRTAEKAHLNTEVEEWIHDIEKCAGIHLPYYKLSSVTASTQGDLIRYMRKTEKNALSCAYAIIAHPILKEGLLSYEETGRVFRKAYGLNQELKDKRISIADLLGVLKEEFSLVLEIEKSGVKLVRIRREGG